jgi:hypothetical protein
MARIGAGRRRSVDSHSLGRAEGTAPSTVCENESECKAEALRLLSLLIPRHAVHGQYICRRCPGPVAPAGWARWGVDSGRNCHCHVTGQECLHRVHTISTRPCVMTRPWHFPPFKSHALKQGDSMPPAIIAQRHTTGTVVPLPACTASMCCVLVACTASMCCVLACTASMCYVLLAGNTTRPRQCRPVARQVQPDTLSHTPVGPVTHSEHSPIRVHAAHGPAPAPQSLNFGGLAECARVAWPGASPSGP